MLTLLLSIVPLLAQGFPEHPLDEVEAAPRVAHELRQVLTGRVLTTEGLPARGAVVTTGVGGRAVAGRDGGFELAVDLPAEARFVEVSAEMTLQGGARTLAGSQRVLLSTSATTAVGPLVVERRDACAQRWLPTFGGGLSVYPDPAVLASFDDGAGPALYLAGLESAGGFPVDGIVRWDGASWTQIGEGPDGAVHAMTVFDDGGGPALHVAGEFTEIGGIAAASIARWDGASWSALGSGVGGPFPVVYALQVFDDGGGPDLYAAGTFIVAGGATANLIARWDGAAWSPLGLGMNISIRALTVWDDGGGPALWAAGDFTLAGGAPATRVARWDGTSWWAPPTGPSHLVHALVAHDDGSGEALYVAGNLLSVGGTAMNRIARWNGTSWSTVGAGMNQPVLEVLVHDDGGGPDLYAAGTFWRSGSAVVRGLARWDGALWSEVGGWAGSAATIAVHDEGGGPALFVSGTGLVNGIDLPGMGRWDGSGWSALVAERTLPHGPNAYIASLVVADDGNGPALYAGGAFTKVGGVETRGIARWDGEGWSALGPGLDSTPRDCARLDGPGGPRLIVARDYSSNGFPVVQWDGTTWSELGSGLFGSAAALEWFDDGSGPRLYAGGDFGSTCNAQRWNGTSWEPLGTVNTFNNRITDLVVFDDGSGPALYAAGYFDLGNGIVRRGGSSWGGVGGGLGGPSRLVESLEVFDDGSGPALYVAGQFTSAGGVPAHNIARWDGVAWSALDDGSGLSGVDRWVEDLTVFDDGFGPALCVAGRFTTAGGVASPALARWDGSTWSGMQGRLFVLPFALTTFDDGGGPGLFVGGFFRSSIAGDQFIARRGCRPRLTER